MLEIGLLVALFVGATLVVGTLRARANDDADFDEELVDLPSRPVIKLSVSVFRITKYVIPSYGIRCFAISTLAWVGSNPSRR